MSFAFGQSPSASSIEGPTKLILVMVPKISGNDESLKHFMSKIAIDVLMRTNQYQLVFSLSEETLKTKLSLYRLDMIVKTKNQTDYDIDFSVIELKNKKVVKKAWAKDIPKRLLLLQTRMSLYELFLGKKFVAENIERIDRENKKKAGPNEKLEAPGADDKDDSKDRKDSKKSQEKKNNKNSKDNKDKKDKKKIKSSLTESEEEEDEALEEINRKRRADAEIENELAIKRRLAQARQLEKFKAEIQEELLKEQEVTDEEGMKNPNAPKNRRASRGPMVDYDGPIPQKIVREKDKEVEEDAPVRKEKPAKVVEENESKLPPLIMGEEKKRTALKRDATPVQSSESRPRYRTKASSLLIEYEFMNRIISSTYILTSINNLNYYGPKVTYRREYQEVGHDAFSLSLSSLKPRISKNDTDAVQIPAIINFDLMYVKSPEYIPLDFIVGFSYERSYFINVVELGAGYQLAKSNFYWLKGGPEFGHKIFFIDYYIQLYYAKMLIGNSDFLGSDAMKLDGSKYGIGLDVGLLSNLRIGAKFEKDKINAINIKQFSLTQESFLFRVSLMF